MDYTKHSTLELLQYVIGKNSAKELYCGSLSSLFAPGEDATDAHAMLAVVRELVKRWLEEELQGAIELSGPQLVKDYLRIFLAGRQHECFVVLFLDARNRLIATEEMFRGTLTQTAVYPREIVKRALQLNAAGTIFAHNHPSGVAEPSRADELLTQTLKQALALVDVKVLDHLVVAGNATTSFAECGLL